MENDINKELFEMIINVYKSMKKNFQVLKDINISMVQLHGLIYIYENKNCSLKDLAKKFSITLPSANDLINKLNQLKLINRKEDKQDRRLINLSITKKGEKLIKSILEKNNQCFSSLINKLNMEEKKQLLKIFKKILI